MPEKRAQLADLLTGLTEKIPARKRFLVGTEELRYGTFRDQVARTRGLFANRGLSIGERIVIATTNNAAMSALYAACLTSGVVAVVIDPDSSAAELTILIEKSRAKAVIADEEILDRAMALKTSAGGPLVLAIAGEAPKKTSFGLLVRRKSPEANAGTYPALLGAIDPVAESEDISPASVALILFTSGTTSNPKGVELTRTNLAAHLTTFRRHYEMSSDCVIVNHLPMHHTDGLNIGPLLAFSLGATLVRPAPVTMTTLGDMLDMIYREHGTHLITVPTVLAMMMRVPSEFDDVFSTPAFRFIASSAGLLAEDLWRGIEKRFRTQVVNAYGLTETVSCATFCGPSKETRRIGTIGKPVDCEARIVDGDGMGVALGDTGELCLRGDNITCGYFDDPDATAAVLQDGWFSTGDLATIDDEGFIRIVGRKKNVIIRGGINVYPEDVDSVLAGHASVQSAVTVGLKDGFLGEKVVSCIVPENIGTPPTSEELLAYCRPLLAGEKIPNQILMFESLPRGSAGKIELAKVRSMAAHTLSVDEPDSDDSTSEKVLAVAARIFQQPIAALSPDLTEDRMEGWNSLSYLEFVMALERQFDFELAPADVMNIRCLGDAIEIVERKLS